MLEKPQILGPEPNKQFEAWIDRAVTDAHDPLDVAAGIAHVTRPGGINKYEVSPEFFGNEGWFWPWNRAGFAYIQDERPEPAAAIFTCAYLAAIRFQHTWQYRIHKGMALCNAAYSYLKAGKPERAGVPALLGLVEAAMTDRNPAETASFRNLVAANYPEALAITTAEFFLFLTRRRGTYFLYPESVLECASRNDTIPSPEIVRVMQDVAAAFTAETVKPALDKLAKVWETIEVVYTRAAITGGSYYGAYAASGWIPIPGSNAPGNGGTVASPGSQGHFPAAASDAGAGARK